MGCIAALFDVDGTLVDTNYLHAVTWWQAFTKSGYGVDMSDIHRAIGMGSDQLLDHLLPRDRERSKDDAIRQSHDALFSVYWPHLRPFSGAAALLRACKRRGQRVVLATSAGANELQAMRTALDAEDAIDEITSSVDVERSKPAPDIVAVALAKAEVGPGEAVFVGDTAWDVRACKQAGIRCLTVLTGGIGRDELEAAGADGVYDSVQDLLDHLEAAPLGG
jgi:HAD superfamily hydrolase (TIGR01509 family)